MLRIVRASQPRVSARFSQVRMNHHFTYGQPEPLVPYLKWVGAFSVGLGLITYDRFLSDGAISKLVTPASNNVEATEETDKYIDELWRQQSRAAVLLAPQTPTTATENFRVQPVPSGSYREAYTNSAIDVNSLSERRPRTQAIEKKQE